MTKGAATPPAHRAPHERAGASVRGWRDHHRRVGSVVFRSSACHYCGIGLEVGQGTFDHGQPLDRQVDPMHRQHRALVLPCNRRKFTKNPSGIRGLPRCTGEVPHRAAPCSPLGTLSGPTDERSTARGRVLPRAGSIEVCTHEEALVLHLHRVVRAVWPHQYLPLAQIHASAQAVVESA